MFYGFIYRRLDFRELFAYDWRKGDNYYLGLCGEAVDDRLAQSSLDKISFYCF